MFGVKERQTVDQPANFVYKPNEVNVFSSIRSILIVDEDRNLLNQLSQSFSICAKQYFIYTAQDGRNALEILKTSSVNILLTASHMPVMNGSELIDYAKFYYPDTRIFVMSDDLSAIKDRLDDSRICGYIRKPFRIEMIYSILRV